MREQQRCRRRPQSHTSSNADSTADRTSEVAGCARSIGLVSDVCALVCRSPNCARMSVTRARLARPSNAGPATHRRHPPCDVAQARGAVGDRSPDDLGNILGILELTGSPHRRQERLHERQILLELGAIRETNQLSENSVRTPPAPRFSTESPGHPICIAALQPGPSPPASTLRRRRFSSSHIGGPTRPAGLGRSFTALAVA